MSWTARITKAPDGELRLQFSEPLRHIDMDRETARHLAALLVVAAEGKRTEPLEADHRHPSKTRARAKKKPNQMITGDLAGTTVHTGRRLQ